jgi:hypothetical protein
MQTSGETRRENVGLYLCRLDNVRSGASSFETRASARSSG